MNGGISHTFQIPTHPQRGDGGTQILGHPLLARHELEDGLLDLSLELVHLLVAADDLFGQPQVRITQRGRRPYHRAPIGRRRDPGVAARSVRSTVSGLGLLHGCASSF